MKTRDLQLDIVRGLAIFSVVLGHVDTGLKGQLIYLFHMPFFFIVSGYFHRVDEDEPRYFRRKCLSLLLPYFVYLLILKAGAIATVWSGFVADPSFEGATNFLIYLAKLVYGGDRLRGYTGVFWFVSCLFLTQQLFNFVSLRVKRQRTLLAISAGMYLLASIDQLIPGYVSFPWTANVVLCAFPFYVMGAVYGHMLFKSKRRIWLVLSLAIALFASVLVAAGWTLSFTMKLAYYGVFVLSPMAALALTKLLSVVAAWLAQVQGLAQLLASLGKASITIMFFHRTVEYTLPDIFFDGPLWAAAIAITAICYLFHLLLLKTRWTRALFLGSYKDADALFRPLSRGGA